MGNIYNCLLKLVVMKAPSGASCS